MVAGVDKFYEDHGVKLKNCNGNGERQAFCPFCHDEKGHFYYSKDGVFMCQRCGIHGNPTTYLRDHNHMDNKNRRRELDNYGLNDSNSDVSEKRIVATYDYVDTENKLLHQTVRYEPKSFSQRRPDGNGEWIWNLKGIETVLYKLTRAAKCKFRCD